MGGSLADFGGGLRAGRRRCLAAEGSGRKQIEGGIAKLRPARQHDRSGCRDRRAIAKSLNKLSRQGLVGCHNQVTSRHSRRELVVSRRTLGRLATALEVSGCRTQPFQRHFCGLHLVQPEPRPGLQVGDRWGHNYGDSLVPDLPSQLFDAVIKHERGPDVRVQEPVLSRHHRLCHRLSVARGLPPMRLLPGAPSASPKRFGHGGCSRLAVSSLPGPTSARLNWRHLVLGGRRGTEGGIAASDFCMRLGQAMSVAAVLVVGSWATKTASLAGSREHQQPGAVWRRRRGRRNLRRRALRALRCSVGAHRWGLVGDDAGDDGNANPPDGWGNPSDDGELTVIDDNTAEFLGGPDVRLRVERTDISEFPFACE